MFRTHRRFVLMLLPAFLAVALASQTHAALTLSIVPPAQAVLQGSAGTLEVDISNPDVGTTYNVSGFQVTVSVDPASGITFTAADTTVLAPQGYILAANGTGLVVNINGTGDTIGLNDLVLDP